MIDRSSSIQTLLSAPESDRFGLSARGLYRRWGISPRPEELYYSVRDHYTAEQELVKEEFRPEPGQASTASSAPMP